MADDAGQRTRLAIGAQATRLVLALAAWQLLLHLGWALAAQDPRLLPPHLVAFAQDALLLGLLLVPIRLGARWLPDPLLPAWRVASGSVLLAAGAGLALYPQSLREYLAFPVDLFAGDLASARVALFEYLGPGGVWPAAVAVALGVAALSLRLERPVSRRWWHWLWVPLILVGVATLPRSPHPLFASLHRQATQWMAGSARVVPALRPPARTATPLPAAPLPAALPPAMVPALPPGPLRADHVFLIVLEGVPAEEFEREFLTLPGGFYAQVKERAAYFRRYYGTNLDSYTALIALLTAVQVPYRAYGDTRHYEAVNQAPNLTRALRMQGFHTLFLSTYAHQPFVPVRADWDRVLERGDLPTLDGWVSLGTSRMEAATEDRAGLATVVAAARNHPRSFVLHEMVYGHSPQWRATTGQTPSVYYDGYLRELRRQLQAAGLAERSLLVIVSDHGDRGRAAAADNYRIPLLLVGASAGAGDDTRFRNHLDLPAIVASWLAGTGLPAARTQTYVVGSTERWVYGSLLDSGAHLFIDDATGQVLARAGALDPGRVAAGFQALLDDFGARHGGATRAAAGMAAAASR